MSRFPAMSPRGNPSVVTELRDGHWHPSQYRLRRDCLLRQSRRVLISHCLRLAGPASPPLHISDQHLRFGPIRPKRGRLRFIWTGITLASRPLPGTSSAQSQRRGRQLGLVDPCTLHRRQGTDPHDSGNVNVRGTRREATVPSALSGKYRSPTCAQLLPPIRRPRTYRRTPRQTGPGHGPRRGTPQAKQRLRICRLILRWS